MQHYNRGRRDNVMTMLRRIKGFTLVELLVVMVVFGILAGTRLLIFGNAPSALLPLLRYPIL